MDYTYNYHQTYLKENKNNENFNEASSSKNPYTVFLNEVLIDYLRDLAIYMVKLKKLGIANEKIKEDIIETISIGILNVEYDEKYFFEMVTKLYTEMVNAKELYIDVCKRNNIKFNTIKSNLKNPSKVSFSNFVQHGQKLFGLKYTNLDLDQMSLIELFFGIIKSVCVHLVELRMLGFDDESVYESLLMLFVMKNSYTPYVQKVIYKKIQELVNIDNKLLRKLHDIKQEKYGDIEPVEISLTTKPGKVILVSGANLIDLERILEATKDKGIDIYTHGPLISAHLYPKFKVYPHLVGHFEKEINNYSVDFTNFPGAILMTRHSFLNVRELFRCRIFTTDPIATTGVGIIKSHNFEPLIEAALHSEGFEETTHHEPIKLNLSEKLAVEKAYEAVEKFKNAEYKNFITVGVSNKTVAQADYFKKFFSLLNESCFVLSFSYSSTNSNILHIQSDYGFPIFYKVMNILTKTIPIEKLNPVVLFTRCETHTFSNLLYIKFMGIDKIYFTDCSASFVNPAVTNFIRKTFAIKDFTTPERDIREMLSINET